MTATSRVERGDWQTPPALAAAVVELVARATGIAPRAVVEPTCGEGTLLLAAAARFPEARLVGLDIEPRHVEAARAALERAPGRRGRASVREADFFAVDWERELASAGAGSDDGEADGRGEGPLLVLGNPPWVTNATLGALGSGNLPVKDNRAGLRGHDARTGKSNFDVCEWMIARLLEAGARRSAATGAPAVFALLCKSAVARKLVVHVERHGIAVEPVGIWRVDAARHFDVNVEAVLFVARTAARDTSAASANAGVVAPERSWPVGATLVAELPAEARSVIAVVDGVLVADRARYERTRHLAGASDPAWRSGMKHDCARVMELSRRGERGAFTNGLGEEVDVEAGSLFPLLKSSDLANGRPPGERAVLVTQRALGEDTADLARTAPRTYAYLLRHSALLDARRSSIYRGQPRFAVFGVGPYTFAPWKVCISGLYKRAAFALVGPYQGRPVVLDDTCYFLPFAEEAPARRALEALATPAAGDFLAGRIFWDDKRPIKKEILQALDLARV